jgi:hypothetical protein
MIRKLLVAATMLAASGAAFAHDSHVYRTEPSFAVAVGTGPYSGFSMSYSSAPYWGPVAYGPAPVVVVPPYYRAYPVPPGHAYKHRHGHGGRGGHHHDHHSGYYRH